MSAQQSAGCVLVDRSGPDPRALVIRVRAHGYELPKGRVEPGETPEEAALRELREETGVESEVTVGAEVGSIEYTFPVENGLRAKQVRFFVATADEEPRFAKLPDRTRELKWVTREDMAGVQLVSSNLRPIILRALTTAESCGPE